MNKLNTIEVIAADAPRGSKYKPSGRDIGFPTPKQTGLRGKVGSASALKGAELPEFFSVDGNALIIDVEAALSAAKESGTFKANGVSTAVRGGNWNALVASYCATIKAAWDKATVVWEIDPSTGRQAKCEKGRPIPVYTAPRTFARTRNVAPPKVVAGRYVVIATAGKLASLEASLAEATTQDEVTTAV